MSRQFRLICRECQSEAVIVKTLRNHDDLYNVACRCKNPECGHRWVANFEYSHTTQPSKLTLDGVLKNLIQRLPKVDLEKILYSVKQQLQTN